MEELVAMVLTFMKIRDTDVTGDEDGDYFVEFLEGFAGSYNFNQITRYSISELVRACCHKLDTFPCVMFTKCYNGIILELQHRLPES